MAKQLTLKRNIVIIKVKYKAIKSKEGITAFIKPTAEENIKVRTG
jgi:hypothetical protein